MQGLGHHTVRVLDDGCVEVVCELPGCNKASAIDVDIDGLNIVIEVEDGCRLELYTTLGPCSCLPNNSNFAQCNGATAVHGRRGGVALQI
jgi:hypothetical protein